MWHRGVVAVGLPGQLPPPPRIRRCSRCAQGRGGAARWQGACDIAKSAVAGIIWRRLGGRNDPGAGCAEPALVGPWIMGGNKIDPELLDATADQTCHPAKIALSDWPLTARESRLVPRRELRRLLKAELGVVSGNRMTLIPQGLCPALDACTQSSICSSFYRHVIDAADRRAGQDVAMLYQSHAEDAIFVAIRCRLCHKKINDVQAIANPPVRAHRLDALQAALPPGWETRCLWPDALRSSHTSRESESLRRSPHQSHPPCGWH